MVIDRSFIFQYWLKFAWICGRLPSAPLPAGGQMLYASGYERFAPDFPQSGVDVPLRFGPVGGRRARKIGCSDGCGRADCMECAAADRRGQGAWPARRGVRAISPGSRPDGSRTGFAAGTASGQTRFSCRELAELFADLRQRNIEKLLVCGLETHVCIQQTVLDLLADGWRVYVAVDAVGSRHDLDHQTALRRMESSGAVLTTTEAALFEWCQAAGTPEFKQISRIVREPEPL